MICPTCGVDAVSHETGACEYCPDHLKNLQADQAAGVDEASTEIRDDIANVLKGSVSQVAEALEGIGLADVSLLVEIRGVELAGKARKGVLAAIEARKIAIVGDLA